MTVLRQDAAAGQSELDVEIETGRKHQIRRHLSGVGFPVVGDRLYGSQQNNPKQPDLQLRAVTLAFTCPLTKQARRYTVDDL